MAKDAEYVRLLRQRDSMYPKTNKRLGSRFYLAMLEKKKLDRQDKKDAEKKIEQQTEDDREEYDALVDTMVATYEVLQEKNKLGYRRLMGSRYEPFAKAVSGWTEYDWKKLVASKYRPEVNFLVS